WFWGGLAILLWDFFIWDDDEYPAALIVGGLGLVCLVHGIWAGLPSDNLILIDRWGTVERASDAGVLRSPFKRLRRLSEEGTVE
ncbi:MAG: hypothetical protein AAB393_17225, partial [Bacteroidota bacterium]